jgi:hypothetical protein
MTKALLLLGALKRQHKINDVCLSLAQHTTHTVLCSCSIAVLTTTPHGVQEERAVLKRLAIEGSDVLLACVQVFEIENDEEDLVHTLQRLALHHRK